MRFFSARFSSLSLSLVAGESLVEIFICFIHSACAMCWVDYWLAADSLLEKHKMNH